MQSGARPVRSTPEQRAKWREKARRAQARKLAAAGQPVPPPALVESPAPAGDVPPAPVSPPPVLWTAAIVRPVFDQLLPVIEALDKASLAKEAAAISPAAARLVAERGGWNPVARTALAEGGSATAAKYLNAAGISAEYAPEVQLGIALASILGGRMLLLNEIRDMAEEKRAAAIEVPVKVVTEGPAREDAETRGRGEGEKV